MTIKTLTTEQLEALTWEVAEIDAGDHELEEQIDHLSDPDAPEVIYQSWVAGTCILRSIEHPEITYTIDWLAQGGKCSMTEAYEFVIEVNESADNELDPGDFEILDIDGEAITPSEAVHQVGNDIEESVEWESEVRKHLPTLGAEDIETIDEDDDMDTIELQRDNGPDVRFQGEQIASASSHHYEGPRNIRWTELVLYRTKGGKLVCHEIGRTRWQGERDRFAIHLADAGAGLVESLGYGRLAKELYDEAGINHAEEIE